MKIKLIFKSLLIGCLLSLVIVPTTAQEIKRLYATQKMNPSVQMSASDRANLEKHVKNFALTGETRQIVLPLVFHILQSPKMTEIGLKEVWQQIEVLNADFSEINPLVYQMDGPTEVFIERAAIPSIRFCLPKTFNGSTSVEPVIIKNSTLDTWAANNDMKRNDVGGDAPINTQKFINIWVCDLDGDISGYAQMPGGKAETDGIVIDYDFFAPGDKKHSFSQGRTLTHLMGSYLGLYELWNEENRCFDDWVMDTPIHNDPNFTTDLIKEHYSTCNFRELEMPMNFMDNTEDAGQYMFTFGQMMRMQAMLAEGGPRFGLTDAITLCEEHFDNSITEKREKAAPTDQGQKSLELNVFPNPANEVINIQPSSTADGIVELYILDMFGHRIWKEKILAQSPYQGLFSVNCKDWPRGAYSILAVQNKKTQIQKIVLD